MSLEELIVHYGYLALFIGTFLEGETILIVAGYLAHIGYLDIGLTILYAFLGTFAGDQTFFHLGRTRGVKFLDKLPVWHRNADKAFDLLAKHQVAIILGFRFIYGIRNVTPFVIGASGIEPWRFFYLNAIGGAAWAISFGLLGFLVGNMLQAIIHDLKKYEMMALGIFCGLALGHFLWSNLKKK